MEICPGAAASAAPTMASGARQLTVCGHYGKGTQIRLPHRYTYETLLRAAGAQLFPLQLPLERRLTPASQHLAVASSSRPSRLVGVHRDTVVRGRLYRRACPATPRRLWLSSDSRGPAR